MRFALIADTFPPLRTSGAVQLRDLSREFVRQGHRLTVMLPVAELEREWMLEDFYGVEVLRLRAPKTKDIGYVRRTLAELMMPFMMLSNLQKSPLAREHWDGVLWYSPSIFHGPLVKALKAWSGCRGYLIIRDIFPEWAADMGLMGRGLPYMFFKGIARYQYAVADIIGVQTLGNIKYFDAWRGISSRKLEVLQNWLGPVANRRCSIRVDETSLTGRKIFVYAGNMGVAQGMDILLDLAERFRERRDVGFLFVGRGSDAERLSGDAEQRGLTNILFFDEIDPDEIPDLYSQCHVGLVALDSRHKSHNIPGKFVTYMQNGLPVLANINPGNDLVELIRQECVGRVSDDNTVDTLYGMAESLLEELENGSSIAGRCRSVFNRLFSAENAVRQIVSALSEEGVGI